MEFNIEREVNLLAVKLGLGKNTKQLLIKLYKRFGHNENVFLNKIRHELKNEELKRFKNAIIDK